MLEIRPEQMAALEATLGTRILLGSLRSHFRRYDPAWVNSMSVADVDQHLLAGIKRARRWGFRSFEGIGVFICGMMSAPQFDRHPAFRAVLSDPSLSEAEKVDGIASAALLRHWRAARDLGPSWED